MEGWFSDPGWLISVVAAAVDRLDTLSVSVGRMSHSSGRCGRDFLEKTRLYVSALSEHHHAIAPKPSDGGQSLHGANLEHLLRGSTAHVQAMGRLVDRYDAPTLLKHFDALRDAISLLPRNPHTLDFLADLLTQVFPEDCEALRTLCEGRTVVLHMSCRARLPKARDSEASFRQGSDPCVHLTVVGVPDRERSPKRLGFRCRNGELRLPVPDAYEFLADKVFFAYLILALVGRPGMVVKIDDDHRLSDWDLFHTFLQSLHDQKIAYAGRFLKAGYYRQEHGWHLEKCADQSLHRMGYQWPFPSRYADGGFGYVLNGDGLSACASMYLGMRAFFAMNAVQLEDVYVGLATEAWGLELQDCHGLAPRRHGSFYLVEEAALPGLRREI